MGLFDTVDSGLKLFRSHFNLSHRKFFDTNFTKLFVSLCKLMLPGDVFKIGGRAIVRYQPTVSPIMNNCIFRTRYFIVPLRQIYENTELIITGSRNGYFNKDLEIPEFPSCFEGLTETELEVEVGSFLDSIGCATGKYLKRDEKVLPANYFFKSYCKIWWDFYRDENLDNVKDFDNFEDFFNQVCIPVYKNGAKSYYLSYNIKKDYFTSSLPFILKGETPVLEVDGLATFTPTQPYVPFASFNSNEYNAPTHVVRSQGKSLLGIKTSDISNANELALDFNMQQITPQSANVTGLGFNMAQLRALAQETRIFERLARCGSRYTEYLQSNFGISPADETLQRALYIGGWKMPIVTTEVLQTAQDGNTPVGTMRGHGIASGGEFVTNYTAKEFCVLMGITTVEPQIIYTQGIPREFTYKERFDFFNPSFQNLSEQAVYNSELYYSSNDDKNKDIFGYQGYYSELRSDVDKAVGNFRTSKLNYWTQSISFSERPYLNNNFINSNTYSADFQRPFNVIEGSYPVLVDYYNDIDAYRPLVKYPVPGLLDHN